MEGEVETFPETILVNAKKYRLSDLCVGERQHRQSVAYFKRHDIEYRTKRHENIDTTDWPQQKNGENTVYAIYIETTQKTSNTLQSGGR